MKADVINLDASPAGSIELSDDVFALEPRTDILQRMVRYQLSKRQAGNAQGEGAQRSERAEQEDLQAEGHWSGPPR